MQIEIVDDCSKGDPALDILHDLGLLDRVQYYKQPKNLGLAGNWNTCIERAKGEVVHILHQDDIVLPGFYTELGNAFREYPTIGAAYCRYQIIDENGDVLSVSKKEQEESGIFRDFLEKISVEQIIQTPSIAVRRNVYEQLGGFSFELNYALDWDMWTRIATSFEVWYDINVLAAYRLHSKSETSHLENSAETIRDLQRFFELRKQYLPEEIIQKSEVLAKQKYAKYAFMRAIKAFSRHRYKSGWALIIGGLRLRTDRHTLMALYRVLFDYFRKHSLVQVKNLMSIPLDKRKR